MVLKIGGRGGRGGSVGRGGYSRHQYKPVHHPFDLALCELAFPRVKPALDDDVFTQALVKRNADLTPTPDEQGAVLSLVTKMQTIFDNLIVSPGSFTACAVDESRQVGSFKKGTMLIGRNIADIVVVLKTLPLKDGVIALGNKVFENLKVLDPNEMYELNQNERGFEINNAVAMVRILVTTLAQNMKKMNPEIHMGYWICKMNSAAIRHSRWFEENANQSTVKVLIRLLQDLRNRFEGFEPLNPWIIDLLAHSSVMNNPSRQALPINVAFRRVLQLLASGLFLPGSSGIVDPVELVQYRQHFGILWEQQDLICLTAQTLVRILAQGGYSVVLEGQSGVLNESSIWNGVVVSPLDIVYERPQPAAKQDAENEEMESADMIGQELMETVEN